MTIVAAVIYSADCVASLADDIICQNHSLGRAMKEDTVEAVDTFLAHPNMAEGAPTQMFFAELSTCH